MITEACCGSTQVSGAANVRTARQAKVYFKPGEEIWLFGVAIPIQRRIVGDLFQRVRSAWTIAESLFKYPEDLIHKATGWMLREAEKPDPARLERFLLEHGPRILRTTLRYAIERFPPEKRKILLEKTRERS
jgi:hypothetical protein